MVKPLMVRQAHHERLNYPANQNVKKYMVSYLLAIWDAVPLLFALQCTLCFKIYFVYGAATPHIGIFCDIV
jgi:hypothetical protein